jgi:hypothetical protein
VGRLPSVCLEDDLRRLAEVDVSAGVSAMLRRALGSLSRVDGPDRLVEVGEGGREDEEDCGGTMAACGLKGRCRLWGMPGCRYALSSEAYLGSITAGEVEGVAPPPRPTLKTKDEVSGTTVKRRQSGSRWYGMLWYGMAWYQSAWVFVPLGAPLLPSLFLIREGPCVVGSLRRLWCACAWVEVARAGR